MTRFDGTGGGLTDSSRRAVLRATASVGAGALWLAGPSGRGRAQEPSEYGIAEARETAYWYARYNVESVLWSGAGVEYPPGAERASFPDLVDGLREGAELDRPPIGGLTSITIAPDATGEPLYGTRPTFEPRPVAPTLVWEWSWDHRLEPEGVAWAVRASLLLARSLRAFGAPERESEAEAAFLGALYELASWWGLAYAFGPDGVLRNLAEENDDRLSLVGEYYPETDERVAAEAPEPRAYAATLWTLSDAATAGSPEFDREATATLASATARTIVEEFDAPTVVDRGGVGALGTVLAALAAYAAATEGNDAFAAADDALEEVADLAAALVDAVAERTDDGRVETQEAEHRAAVQAAVGQGLERASRALGTDADVAEDVLAVLFEEYWNDDLGTFEDGRREMTLALTTRDAGDIVGGLTAAGAFEALSGTVEEVAPRFVEETITGSRLQRAQRWHAAEVGGERWIPLAEESGGTYGQAPVFYEAVTYDREYEDWTVTDRSFRPASGLYAACQLDRFARADGAPFETD
ncbi:hypothetical protein [Natrononativus amylolyticus]|uniref:hypothetical protein n=1 Tax=Natrononativus amylolyticus TaxID=2963434 RepID=UPI0020CFE2EB|nr:hypothetical protein [Natrononativus amylolyticus]